MTEYKVKVAYIYNFCRYIEWPESAFLEDESPLVIGVLGEDPFGSLLDTLAKRKKVKGRTVVVKRFRDWEQYTPCHVLFVPDTLAGEIRQLAVRSTQQEPTLVVGETHGFAKAGGSVYFHLDSDGTIGFEINIDAINRQQLRVNAKLLKLATVVHDQNLK